MSILDLILENPFIIVSFALSLLILLTAGVLFMVGLVRALLAERHRIRSLSIDHDLPDNDTEDDRLDDTMPTPLPLNVKWAGKASVEIESPASETEIQLETENTSEDEEEVSEEMQDILSSVFAEESEESRYASLLRDQQIPSVQELVTLSQAVSTQLASSRYPRRRDHL